MYKIDKTDKKIIFELDKDSRQPLSELAKKTKQSRDVVAYRIKQLEQEGIIQKYITLIDFTKLGYQIVRLYLKLQNTTEEIEEEIAHYFLKQKNILTVYRIEGPFDLAIGFLVKDLRNYQQLYEQFLKKYKPYVVSKDFTILLDFLHYYKNYLVEKKQHNYKILSTGSNIHFTPDKKDLELLKAIAENSRITLLELAEKLNMTSTGVKYKLKQLEKQKVIVAYRLLVDYRKLGYEYYKVDIDVEDMNILPALHQFTVQHPNIIYRDVTIGGRDFEVDGEFRNQEEFYQFMRKVKELFPKKIRNYFYYRALKIYKYAYFPEL